MIHKALSTLVIVYRGNKITFMVFFCVLVSQGCCDKVQARVGMGVGEVLNFKDSFTDLGTRSQIKANSGHLSLKILQENISLFLVVVFLVLPVA